MQVASIGALLEHMLRDRALNDLDDEGITGLDIRDIEILSLHVLFSLEFCYFQSDGHWSLAGVKSCTSMLMHLCWSSNETS